MAPAPWTSSLRRLATLMGFTITTLVLLLPASDSSASSVAELARRLAADTQLLADARDDLEWTRDELRSLRREHHRLRVDVEARLVAIYKFGNAAGALTRVASGESMREVGSTLDALDQVAEHDAKVLRRWQLIDRRRTRLLQQRNRLAARVRQLEEQVQAARERLSAAERAAAQARRQAEEMARIKDSPLLRKVGHPETTAVAAAGGAASTLSAQPIGFVQSGVASVYADSFTGEKTANGEYYDPNAFTAAHPSLPFGTWVTVTGDGGSVSVRINDRGPFVGGRVIDLSRAAGAAIGLRLGEVTIRVAA